MRNKRLIKQNTMSKLMSLLFLSPWIIGFIAFALFPFIEMIRYAFSNVIFKPNNTIYVNVGWKNFRDVLFVDPDFRLLFFEYLRIIVFMLPIILVFALILGTLLDHVDRGKSFFRSIYFLPVILISGPLLEKLFAIEAFKLDGLHDFFIFDFISSTLPRKINEWLFFIIDNIILSLWFCGVQLLIFLTGIQRIDGSLYEAAKIEGASSWQLFWKITIPMLKPFIILNAVYTLVDLSSTFSPISGLITSSMTSDNKGYGYAAAVAWLYLLIELVLLGILMFILARDHQAAKARKEKRKEARKIQRIRKRQSAAREKYAQSQS